jgi:PAS domain S-box-containing protein
MSLINPARPGDELIKHPFELEMQENLLTLKKAHNRYWNLYEFAPMGYFCLSEKKIILDVNYTGASLLGIEKSRLLEKKCLSSFIAKDYRSLFSEHCHHAFDNNTKQHCEVQMIKKDGTFFDAYLESIAVQNDAESNKQLRLSISDVTQRKYAEEQAHQRQLALHQAAGIYSAGGMASALAHELNQPLTAITNFINGCIRRLKKGVYQLEELLDIMQQTAEQAERAGNIIHNIKEFVLKGKPHYETVNIHNIIQTTVISFYAELAASEMKISLKLNNTPLYSVVDAIKIELVLLNFLRNGFEAMRKMPKDSERLLTIYTQIVETSWVKVSVVDSGHGFDKNAVNKMFDPYFTTKQHSLGMGLWVCRSIIEAHGGQLTAENTPARGACFAFTLPLKQEADYG